MPCVRLIPPAFAALYASLTSAERPLTEVMLTMTPPRRSIIEGSTAWLQRNTLFNTTETSRSHVGSSIFRTSSPSAMAALLTSTSTGPSFDATSWTIAFTSAPLLTSARNAWALPPISAATSSAFSPFQSTTATFAPSAANFCAITRPMPEPLPVTMTTWSLKRIKRLRNQRQHDPTRMRGVVQHCLDADPPVAELLGSDRVARVQVAVPVREVARRHLHPYAVAGFEDGRAGTHAD